MAGEIEAEFISNFHCLTGITIKERSKNLFNLLNKVQHSLPLTSGKINLSSLVPTNPLEENFKVTSLIHFRCADELLNVLKSENPVLIDKVLKNSSWIIKQVCNDLTPDYLATQLFPNISYNAKLKLLHQLSLHLDDSYAGDAYFNAIKKCYGFYLASKLLAACSSNLIIECIENYKVEITPKQLMLIINRHPTLIENIFQKLNLQNAKISVGVKYKSVFKYLSTKNVELFIKLYEKYSPEIQLGHKETDLLIKNAISVDAVTSVSKLSKILKTKQIGKSMGIYFSDFYFAIFPKCINALKYNLEDTLNVLSYLSNGPERLKIFLTTFEKIYGSEIWQYPDLIHNTLIEWMSPDERIAWMECHSRPSNISEETWISYYKCDRSIPLLKEKVLLTSNIDTRSKCIIALLNTCKVNRDESALLNVVKYVNLRHRNDHNSVIRGFLSTFNNHYKSNQLTKEHWNEIYQCIQLFDLNRGYWYYHRELLEKCIHHMVSHNLPINSILEFFSKQDFGNFNFCTNEPKLEKHCLKEFEQLIPLAYKNKNLNVGYVKYLYCVNLYNLKNPRDKLLINIRDEYFEYIKSTLESDDDYYAQGAMSALIFQNCSRAEEGGLLELYFKQDSYYLQFSVMEHLIKENPLLLMKYFKFILNATSYQHFIPRFVRKFCPKYSHLDIPQNISKLCYNVINDKEISDNRKIKAAIIILSLVTTPQEFIKFASTYYPTELAPNLKSEINQMLYIKQQTIAGHFKNLIPLSQTLDGILCFCKGDYLKFSQKSLSAASENVAENKLLQFFTALATRAVSVRKHAMFLLSRVLNKSLAKSLLLDLKEKEKNLSLYKVLFKTVFYNFLNDPDDYAWDYTKQIMSIIDVSDGEAFNILTSCSQVPLHYFSRYLEFSWNIIQKCTSSQETVKDGQIRLLNLAKPANISVLSGDFCRAIIQHNLFKCEQPTDLQIDIQSFTCRYLIYGSGTHDERLQTVFVQISDLEISNWKNIKTIPIKLKLLYNFVKQFCDDIIDKDCINKTIFGKFFNCWTTTFQPSEAFDEFMYLQLTSIYLNALQNKLNIFQIGESIGAVCEQLHKEDCLAVAIFSSCLITFLHHFYSLEFVCESDENIVTFIQGLISNRTSFEILELAIYLLPTILPLAPKVKFIYDSIVEIISKESNHKLQVIFCIYLKNSVTPGV